MGIASWRSFGFRSTGFSLLWTKLSVNMVNGEQISPETEGTRACSLDLSPSAVKAGSQGCHRVSE